MKLDEKWIGEEWRAIPGFEGRYEISDQGRVRSLDRIVRRFQYGKWADQPVRGRLLKQSRAKSGHMVLMLGRRSGIVLVHRLVLEAFSGPPPPGCECCHNNGDSTDNRIKNLRWDTRSGNNFDRVRHGTDHNAVKTHCKRGHEFTPENTAPNHGGGRRCRACRRITESSGYKADGE